MPQNRSKERPPEPMTWARAVPVLAVALIFDALRLFFGMFWFFGPGIAALYCANTATGWVGSMWGLTVAVCAAAATSLGFLGAPAIAAFGVVMAIAVGLMGWLLIGLLLIMTNARIFKENALWFAGSLLISEIPIVGALPALTGTLVKMYKNQIKIETMILAKWEAENAAKIAKQRAQQAVEIMQYTQETEKVA